jgi:hypothetical protein
VTIGHAAIQTGGKITYGIMGKITNTSDESIDSIGDIAIFDKDGKLIRLKALEVQLEPNGSMYFDEIVDQHQEGVNVE